MRNQERCKAHLGQKNTRQPISLQNQTKHQHDRSLGPPKNHLAKAVQGGANQGAGTPLVRPHPLATSQALPSRGGTLNAPRTVARVLTKNISPNHHTQAIKRGPLSHSHIIMHIGEEERLHTFHYLLSQTSQGVREERVRGIAEQQFPLLLVLGKPCTQGGWRVKLVGPSTLVPLRSSYNLE